MKISLLEQDEFRWLPRWHVAYTRNADIATTPVCKTTGTYRDGGEFGAKVAEVEGREKWCPDCLDWLRLRKGKVEVSMTIQIDKAENGYILKMRGKVYIADSFGDAMYKCALVFDEKEIVQMARDESEFETDRRKPGRPRKVKEAQ